MWCVSLQVGLHSPLFGSFARARFRSPNSFVRSGSLLRDRSTNSAPILLAELAGAPIRAVRLFSANRRPTHTPNHLQSDSVVLFSLIFSALIPKSSIFPFSRKSYANLLRAPRFPIPSRL
ncbi:hypothetical protein PAXRUDRAFT_821804 [Paxillus rubicundulus Ve08.2h10]|uniref:Uncharacterized protein n=1 Tax=Paxillus rubicundulus Ve08.2h10 TaxID=930991 RepID=A0A0D0E641_9AGAM|nr:hypothetical protein PAXRUDRAFT_821804 [Paxillus rubicundulus Ve08.2h10]